MQGKKKLTTGLLSPFIATAVTAIFIKMGLPPDQAADLGIKVTIATAGGYMGLEFLRDILRAWRTKEK
jgi:hypothetical protein